MTTIPAASLINVTPSVLSAGGAELDVIGLVLTSGTRVPIGTVQSFPSAATVGAYFGLSSTEYRIANGGTGQGAGYFGGFTGANVLPGSILYAQCPQTSVAAFLRGGPTGAMTVAQLQGLSGSLTVTMDGVPRSSANINLSGASSFSNAATIIQNNLNTSLPTAATVTGSITPGTVTFNGIISGNIMTVTGTLSGGSLVLGGNIAGSGVTVGTTIQSQLTGTIGGSGTYVVSNSQIVATSITITETYGILTTTAVSGTLSAGQTVGGTVVSAGTLLTQFISGSGNAQVWAVNQTQTVPITALTASATPLSVTYDSVSGAFVITSGITGTTSTVAYPTGTLAPLIFLTLSTGAILSQGAVAQTPSAFMAALIAVNNNWATFMLSFDPDLGQAGGPQKLAFSAWTNTTNGEFAFICWDTDLSPTTSSSASSSLGALITAAGYSGTCLIWEPSDQNVAAFICGAAASIDFEAPNGRITFAYKGQSGLVAGVTSQAVASNLIANGYNFFGAYATASQTFVQFQNGSVSGPFKWLDSYINQIWLNSLLQLTLMQFMTQVKSVPYTNAGNAQIEAALSTPIAQGLTFGAYSPGVVLSSGQIQNINTTAGAIVTPTLVSQGWYLLILPATPAVRAVRGSPPCTFWYLDGGSIQQINLSSIEVQ